MPQPVKFSYITPWRAQQASNQIVRGRLGFLNLRAYR